ncbi:unnamed protein product, partial [Ilex paraguariensis]
KGKDWVRRSAGDSSESHLRLIDRLELRLQFSGIYSLLEEALDEEEESIEDGESSNILCDDFGCLRFLAVHGQSSCLDRSSPGRKARKNGEGSGDKESEGRATATSQGEGSPCLRLVALSCDAGGTFL